MDEITKLKARCYELLCAKELCQRELEATQAKLAEVVRVGASKTDGGRVEDAEG